MDVRIEPSRLQGKVEIKSSKSDAHRTLIGAALADNPTRVQINGVSEDIQATVNCLKALGAEINENIPGIFDVAPVMRKEGQPVELDCGESGTTLRFMIPVAAALGGPVTLKGSGRLPYRPNDPLIEALNSHGCRVTLPSLNGAQLPMKIEGQLTSGTFQLPGDISSQFISGLLLSFPVRGEGGTIRLSSPVQSGGYIDMTIDTLKHFNVAVASTPEGFKVEAGQCYRSPQGIIVEGDWSNAAFWLSAGSLGGPVECTGLHKDSLQGDRAVMEILHRAGAGVRINNDVYRVFSEKRLQAVEIDAREIPDLVPVLSVVAATSEGVTRVYNAERLRIKESDRLKTTAELINRLGGNVVETEDGLIIQGVEALKGGEVDSANDHRIAMAAAVASVKCETPVVIRRAEAVNKSYPDFFEDFKLLGGRINVI